MTDSVLDDTSAMNHIANILDGEEWDSGTHELVAEIVEKTGRKLRVMEDDVIRVYIEGGLVQNVTGIPENTTVKILDTDKNAEVEFAIMDFVSQET